MHYYILETLRKKIKKLLATTFPYGGKIFYHKLKLEGKRIRMCLLREELGCAYTPIKGGGGGEYRAGWIPAEECFHSHPIVVVV